MTSLAEKTCNSLRHNLQGVSKIHGITSGMGSSYVDNKNSLYQHTSGNAVSEFLRSVYDTPLFTVPYSKCSICPPPA
jgi:putative flippase GtrA